MYFNILCHLDVCRFCSFHLCIINGYRHDDLRKKSPSLLRPYKTWGYPLTPILFVGINIWIVIFSIRNNLTAFIWGLVTIVVGLVAYECFERNARKSNNDQLPKTEAFTK